MYAIHISSITSCTATAVCISAGEPEDRVRTHHFLINYLQNVLHREWMSDWMTAWVIDWLTEWVTGSGRTTAFSTTFKMGYAVSEWMNYCLSGWLTDWVTEWQGRDALGPFPIPSKNATLWANEWMNDRKENRILIWTSKKSPGSESDPRKTPCSFFMKIGNFNCTFWQLILIIITQ